MTMASGARYCTGMRRAMFMGEEYLVCEVQQSRSENKKFSYIGVNWLVAGSIFHSRGLLVFASMPSRYGVRSLCGVQSRDQIRPAPERGARAGSRPARHRPLRKDNPA